MGKFAGSIASVARPAASPGRRARWIALLSASPAIAEAKVSLPTGKIALRASCVSLANRLVSPKTAYGAGGGCFLALGRPGYRVARSAWMSPALVMPRLAASAVFL